MKLVRQHKVSTPHPHDEVRHVEQELRYVYEIVELQQVFWSLVEHLNELKTEQIDLDHQTNDVFDHDLSLDVAVDLQAERNNIANDKQEEMEGEPAGRQTELMVDDLPQHLLASNFSGGRMHQLLSKVGKLEHRHSRLSVHFEGLVD
jgi:chromosome segregation ATPase